MLFLSGSTFLSADIMSVSLSPTNVGDITEITLQGCYIDDFYATQNVDEPITDVIPEDWDFDTVMHALFNNSTSAGNVDWSLNMTSHLIIKRKKEGDFKWITLYTQEVHTYDDFKIIGVDRLPGNGKYTYAVVPINNGSIEGNYTSATLDVVVNKLVLLDSEEMFSTVFCSSDISIQHVLPSQAVETMYNKYPTIISNGDANYRTITVSAGFYPTEENEKGCTEFIFDAARRIAYQEEFLKFLHNKKVKLLKTPEGRLYLIWITTPASLSFEDGTFLEEFSFGGTEVGDVDDEEFLYDAGLIQADSHWWN